MLSLVLLLFTMSSSEAGSTSMITCQDKHKDWSFELSLDANGNGEFNSKNSKTNATYKCKITADSIFDYSRSHASHYKLNLVPHSCSSRHPDFLKKMALIIEQQNKTHKIKVQWLETTEFEYCQSGNVKIRDIQSSLLRFQKNTWPLKTK